MRAGAGAGLLLWRTVPAVATPPSGTLDPSSLPKYVEPLVIPPAMPRTRRIIRPGAKPIDYYEIGVRQFEQQILPPGAPRTRVWGYGSVNDPASFNYPSFTVEAKWRAPVRVKWINQLVDGNGDFLPHLLPVDQTLHWANPPGGAGGRDGRGTDQSPYAGPVPIVTHLHGGHSTEYSDGFPRRGISRPRATSRPGTRPSDRATKRCAQRRRPPWDRHGSRAAPCSSTTTTRRRPRTGTTTTRSG